MNAAPALAPAPDAPTLPLGRPNLEIFSETLRALARDNPDLLVVTSDSRGSGKLAPFAAEFPRQIVEVGIAEQNLVGVAAGLASCGKTVFAVSPACFLTARALEQIKNDVCYSQHPVTLVGISAGVSYGALGATHHSLHDFAVLRTIPNLHIVAPADNAETRAAVRAAAAAPLPVYLRFGKFPLPDLHAPSAESTFQLGRAVVLREGDEVAFIATGETVCRAIEASDLLRSDGCAARVVSMHTLKPLDTRTLLDAALTCRAIVTIEEHSVAGGLGEACASFLLQTGCTTRFQAVAFPDHDLVTGSQSELFVHYGFTGRALAAAARTLLTASRP